MTGPGQAWQHPPGCPVPLDLPSCDEPLTCETLRAELQLFAQKELRRELAECVQKVEAEIRTCFREVPPGAASNLHDRRQILAPLAPRNRANAKFADIGNQVLRQTASSQNTHISSKLANGGQGRDIIKPSGPRAGDHQADLKKSAVEMLTIEQAGSRQASKSSSIAEVVASEPPRASISSAMSAMQRASAAAETSQVETWDCSDDVEHTVSDENLRNARLYQADHRDIAWAAPKASKNRKRAGPRQGMSYQNYITARSDTQRDEELAHRKSREARNSSLTLDDEQQGLFNRVNFGCEFLERAMEYPVLLVIMLNGVFLGIQAQYQSSNLTESVPQIFPVFEIIFCVVFTLELIIHLGTHGVLFWSPCREGWAWNWFDSFLVVVQLIEVIGMFTTGHESSTTPAVANMGFLRMLRVLRLFRVLRLVRLLQFISELKTIVSSIANSMRSLFWTVVLLLLQIYMFGIVFTQLVLSHRIEYEEKEKDDEHMQALYYWWGTLFRSCLSLYEAILGGVDWDDVCWPLMQRVSILLGPIFIVYIAFSVLAMMNVITGIFVDSALHNAEKEKDKDFMQSFRSLMEDVVSEDGTVTLGQFETKMSMPELRAQVSHVGIEPKDAGITFNLIDTENAGVLEVEDLLAGLLRMRSHAKALDIALMLNESQAMHTRVELLVNEGIERSSEEARLHFTSAVSNLQGEQPSCQGDIYGLPAFETV